MRDPIRPASLAVLLNRREPLLEALYIVERSPTILRKGIGIREGRNLEPSTKDVLAPTKTGTMILLTKGLKIHLLLHLLLFLLTELNHGESSLVGVG